MPASRSQVLGLKQLSENFKKLQFDMQEKTARRATNAAAQIIKRRVIELAPLAKHEYKIEGLTVQPGNIQRSVVVKRVKPGETPLTSEHVVAIRGKARYGYASRIASIHEYGSVRMNANPFVRPAFLQKAEAAKDAMVEALQSGIDKALK